MGWFRVVVRVAIFGMNLGLGCGLSCGLGRVLVVINIQGWVVVIASVLIRMSDEVVVWQDLSPGASLI